MTIPLLQGAFSAGEISPSLYGRLDLTKWHQALSVGRNVVVSYKGGVFSRAGLAFVGASKQPASASSIPPRIIEFSFSIFQSYILEFGEQYMRVVADGGYVTESSFAITAVNAADPIQVTAPGHNYAVGDWVFIAGTTGSVELNGVTFVVGSVPTPGSTFTLNDIFGQPLNGALFPVYTGGGTVARLFTLVTPYHAADLDYLKFTQSADVMSIACVNQKSLADYPPQELTRHAANSWTIAPPTFASSIGPPAGAVTVTHSNTWSTGPGPAAYGFMVTAVDAVTGQESIASAIGVTTNSVDIAGQFGTLTVTWAAVAGAGSYNVYKANPDYTNAGNFVGQFFGFVGSTAATSWQDTNIFPDFATTPPLHVNPFPSTGNYPGVVAYFQQRRAYAETVNEPDTYFMSQPGAFLNFDSAIPPIDSDAITGTPWASQVNAVQWMLPMPGGLVVFTGKDAWQVSGTGGIGSPITPSQQNAQPQESIGASATLPPLKIGYNILYQQSLGSIVRELNYNFYFNIYAGADITVLSSHLFTGFQLQQWAWCQEPYKVIWSVRSDGRLLSQTYVKDQNVDGWTRSDTNGLFVSTAKASEPPVDAPYFVVKRFISGVNQWAYFLERMDNRIWPNAEACWCVDAGLSLTQPTPNATLSASAAKGSGGVLFDYVVTGGLGYTAPAFAITDAQGYGSGASVSGFTLGAGGAITGVTIVPGVNYVAPQIEITDSNGSGAVIALSVDQSVTFTASVNTFSGLPNTDVGKVIRMGGGIATITAIVDAQHVTANVTKPITATMPNDPNAMPIPAVPGQWSMTEPVQTVSGLHHLEGMTVTGLMDGSVVPPTVVVNGQVSLPYQASQVTLGLPFIAQAQGMHADMGGEMIQGKRKRVQGVTVRVNATRGILVGQDQPIAATQENQAELPWNVSPSEMTEMSLGASMAPFSGNAVPLFTGDHYLVIKGDYSTTDGQPSPGMVAVMQTYPLPFELTAFVPQVEVGDVPN
jgi:hypothetical protein